jgi:hypothetical protein
MENNEQEMETPQTEEGEETPEVPAEKTKENQDELLKKFQSAEAQKEHWREKAEKAEAELKKLKPEEQPKTEPKIVKETNPKLMLRLSKALTDYNEDEIDFIYQVSRDDSPETIIETSKSDWVQLAINAKREKVAKEKQIPEPGNVPGGKSTKGLSVEDIDKEPDSHKKAFDDFRKTGKLPGEGI